MMLPSRPNTREVEVSLEAAQRFPGQDVELDGDQRAVGGIENPVRRRGPDQPVADISPCVVDVHHLRILDVGIGDLAIARLDLGLQVLQLQQVVAGQRVHAGDEIGEVVAHHEVGAVGLEGFHRSRRALVGGAPCGHQPALAGQIGILLGAGQREFLLDDALGEHEPRIIVAAAHDVVQLAERVRAGKQRRGQPRASRVEPHRRRPGQDADAMARPDRIPVPDALDIMPHPVAVDQPGAGDLGDPDHAAVDMFGHAGDHVARSVAEPLRPVLPHQFVIAADAARGHDHGLGAQGELADSATRAAVAARDRIGREDRACDLIRHGRS